MLFTEAYALASKIIRECKEEIETGEEAHHKRGIGDHIAKHIDEFLTTGKVGVLEELRATTSD
jgi:DNA polymerase/3'-5' exonuclease PolX